MIGASGARESSKRLRWQWTLSHGGGVAAEIDVEAGTETISQGSRVLSRCPRGGKPAGHSVLVAADRAPGRSERPPIEAVIVFEPLLPICVLRVDGDEVAPTLWPVRQRPARPAEERPWARYVLGGLSVAALLTCVVVVRSRRCDAPSLADRDLGRVHRASSGLFVAHYPDDLVARVAILPGGVGGVVLEDETRTTNIVIAATTAGASGARDPWALQHLIRDEAIANLSKGVGKYEESGRRDETCLGTPGAVVTGRILANGDRHAKVWSCAFVRDDAGYFTLYMLPEPALGEDERRLRSILDATELTRLADLGPSPAIGVASPPATGAPASSGLLAPLRLP